MKKGGRRKMKEKNARQTQLYNLNFSDIDEVLKTYEIIPDARKDKSKKIKKKIFWICLCLFIAGTLTAVLFFVLKNSSSNSCVVVKSGSNISITCKNTFDLPYNVDNYIVSYENNIFAFVDSNKKLYCIRLDKCKDVNDVNFVFEGVEKGISFYNQNSIVFKSNDSLYIYDFKNILKISDNVSDFFTCGSNKNLFFLTKDKKLFATNVSETNELLSNVSKIDFHSQNERMNLVVTSVKDSKECLYLCREDANAVLISDSFTEYFCGEKDEVWDNIYFFSPVQNQQTSKVKFIDKYYDFDFNMKEPVSSDYQRSFVFGLIQYVDPSQYKKAYVEYQKKLMRDKVREFEKNYLPGEDNMVNVFCFRSSSSILLKQNIKKNNVLHFRKNFNPAVLFSDEITDEITVDVDSIALQLKKDSSQEDFNKIINDKIKNATSFLLKVKSSETENDVNISDFLSYDSFEFINETQFILVKKNECFSLFKTGENSCEIIFENVKIKDIFYNTKNIIYTDDQNICYNIDLNTGEKTQPNETKVIEITKLANESFLLKCSSQNGYDYKIYSEKKLNVLVENAVDFVYLEDSNYLFIKNNEIFSRDGKLYELEKDAQIVK